MSDLIISDESTPNYQELVILDSENQSLEVLNDSFSDGRWGAIIGAEPQPYQLLSSDYRAGYQAGLDQKWDEKLTDLYF